MEALTGQVGLRSERALRLVPGGDRGTAEWGWFCGHCAAPSPGGVAPAPYARVCGQCGLGLLLEARTDALPQAREPFLVVDSSLLVQGVSRRAERVLAVPEEQAVNRPVAQLLVAADVDPDRPRAFADAILAALEGDEPRHAFARPWNTFGVRIRIRMAACGPPRAALLVLESSLKHQLRAVGPS